MSGVIVIHRVLERLEELPHRRCTGAQAVHLSGQESASVLQQRNRRVLPLPALMDADLCHRPDRLSGQPQPGGGCVSTERPEAGPSSSGCRLSWGSQSDVLGWPATRLLAITIPRSRRPAVQSPIRRRLRPRCFRSPALLVRDDDIRYGPRMLGRYSSSMPTRPTAARLWTCHAELRSSRRPMGSPGKRWPRRGGPAGLSHFSSYPLALHRFGQSQTLKGGNQ